MLLAKVQNENFPNFLSSRVQFRISKSSLGKLYDEQKFQMNYYITVKFIDFYDFEVATIWFPFGFPAHDSLPKILSFLKYFK